MSIIARPIEGEDDYQRVRRMLIAAIADNERHYCSVGDLDWWRFTSNDPDPLGTARLWLDADPKPAPLSPEQIDELRRSFGARW